LNATRHPKERFKLADIERCAKIVGEENDLLTFTRLMISLDDAFTNEVISRNNANDTEF